MHKAMQNVQIWVVSRA